jgi:hypothetical protein
MVPIPRHFRSVISKTCPSSALAMGLPSRLTVRAYWFSTSARPASSWRTTIRIPCRRSIGSNPVTTIGTR